MKQKLRILPRKPIARTKLELPELDSELPSVDPGDEVIDPEACRAYADWLRHDAPTQRQPIGKLARPG